MSDEYEKADIVGPYDKSLLYLICRALEQVEDTPILGLEQSLSSEVDMAKFFGLGGNTSNNRATVIFSQTDDYAAKHSRSLIEAHGSFNNDHRTHESVLRITRTHP